MQKVLYRNEAREHILEGARILYEAVKTTLGPQSGNVIINRGAGAPVVTHDGVTVAKGVMLKESEEQTGYSTGIELIKQAAIKVNDTVGDGTTTVTILTYHLLKQANQMIAAGANPMTLRRDLEIVADELVGKLMTHSHVIDETQVAEIATISAGDPIIGELIADVITRIGKDGVVTVEADNGLELSSEIVEGFTFDRGYVSPYLVTDQARMEAVYQNPYILITDQKISAVQEIMPLLEKIVGTGRKELVIVAEDFDGEALGTLILNKLKGSFNSVMVKTPGFGAAQAETLEDLALLTGAKVISPSKGVALNSIDLDSLGSARKVIVTKDETTIIEGAGRITDRLKQLRTQIKEAKSEHEKENLQQRLAALENKIAVIKVGGTTETEIEEKKFRVDDAVAAVKAALEEGIVPGGETTLVSLSRLIGSETAAERLMGHALLQPFRILLKNSGMNPDQVLDKVGRGMGIDVKTGELENMKDVGIIDPTKVVREAIQTAVSVAGVVMTMGSLIVEIPEDKPGMLPPGMVQ